MKCPKYIRDKIMRRAKVAAEFMKLDQDISNWIDSKGIDSEYAMPGYVESLCGAYQAAEDCLKDIEEA